MAAGGGPLLQNFQVLPSSRQCGGPTANMKLIVRHATALEDCLDIESNTAAAKQSLQPADVVDNWSALLDVSVLPKES